MIVEDICRQCDGRCCIGCRNYTPMLGCTIDYQCRPISCQLYPFVRTDTGVTLSDDCPHGSLFWKYYVEALEMIR